MKTFLIAVLFIGGLLAAAFVNADARMNIGGVGTCHFVKAANEPNDEMQLNFCEISIYKNDDGTVNGWGKIEKRSEIDRPERVYLSGWDIGAPCVVVDDEGMEYESNNYWNIIIPPTHVSWVSFYLYCQGAEQVEGEELTQ